MRPPVKLERKPISTAFWAKGNTIGASRAGIAPGTTLAAMPWKAGTSSPRIVRTPKRMTATAMPNCRPWVTDCMR